ncbi:MAG: hypothetical protein K9J13_13460 [Saprospiraceae bacterium]|nr:hypothetical protein [Saprospiraceae bacterium]
MKHTLLILLSILLINNLNAQKIGAFAGSNLNNNYTLQLENNNHHYNTNYNPGLGFSAGLCFDDIKLVRLPIKFTFRFSQYNGEITEENSGIGGGANLSVNYKKNSFGVGFYPINIKIKNNTCISFGVVKETLINEKIEGSKQYWGMNVGSYTTSFNEDSIKLSLNGSIAFVGTISFEKEIANGFYIFPQFTTQIGLTQEIQHYYVDFKPKAIRFFFEVGLYKKL